MPDYQKDLARFLADYDRRHTAIEDEDTIREAAAVERLSVNDYKHVLDWTDG